MEIEFNELGFHVQKPSSLNSFSMNSAPMGLLQNGLDQMSLSLYQIVLRVLDCWQTSSLNSFSLNSAHMGLLDRLVQKIVGCVCRRSCNFLW